MARRLLLSIAIVGFAVTTATVIFAWEDAPFQQVPTGCVPPEFGDPPIVRPIDRATTGCDLDGEASASDPTEAAKQSAQNVMKNEFCAWRNTDPALVTRYSFDQLQKRLPAGFPWGSRTNMPTAEELKAIREFYTTSEGDTIGEGSNVIFVAYLLERAFRRRRERQLRQESAPGRGPPPCPVTDRP